MRNQLTWGGDKPLREWMTKNRLDGFSQLVRGVDKNDTAKVEIIQRMKNNGLRHDETATIIQQLDQMKKKN